MAGVTTYRGTDLVDGELSAEHRSKSSPTAIDPRSQQILADTGSLLATALDVGATVQRVGDLTVPALAELCLLHFFTAGDDGGEIKRVLQVMHPYAGAIDWAPPIKINRLRSDNPIAIAIRTQKPVRITEVENRDLVEIAADEARLPEVRSIRPRTLLCLPLVGRERVLGTLTLVSSAVGRGPGPVERRARRAGRPARRLGARQRAHPRGQRARAARERRGAGRARSGQPDARHLPGQPVSRAAHADGGALALGRHPAHRQGGIDAGARAQRDPRQRDVAVQAHRGSARHLALPERQAAHGESGRLGGEPHRERARGGAAVGAGQGRAARVRVPPRDGLRAGRQRAPAPGAGESAVERDQVHRPRRPGHRARGGRRRARRDLGRRHRLRDRARLPVTGLPAVPPGRRHAPADPGRPRPGARDRAPAHRDARRHGARRERGPRARVDLRRHAAAGRHPSGGRRLARRDARAAAPLRCARRARRARCAACAS